MSAGRGTLGRLIHVDLRAMAARIADLTADPGEGLASGRAAGLVRWAGLFVRNFELTLYWGLAWAVAHVAVLLLAEAFWSHAGVPARVSLPLEVIPGAMFVISVVRLATCMARVRQIHAMTPPAQPGLPRLVNPPRPAPLLRLLEPTDLDLLVPLALAVAAEVFSR
jgi:hypothetical protein